MIGQTIGDKYRLEQEIGSGGWAAVYKAKHIQLGSSLAIKILAEHLTQRPQALERFRNEASIVSQLSHPNIVNVIDYGVLPDGRPYIVMDFINGQSLSQILAQSGPMDYQRAVSLFIDVCAGLAHAHNNNVLHRDIKPGNIVVVIDANGKEKALLLDFGLAKLQEDSSQDRLTQTGETIGTISYMSPEQCQGARLDNTSDIYSLGCTMYETLCGIKPFKGDNVIQLMDQHIKGIVPRLTGVNPKVRVPRLLEDTIMHALEKNPADRFQSAGELSAALKQGAGHPSLARVVANDVGKTRRYLTRSWRSPMTRVVTLSVILVCGLAGAIVPIVTQHHPIIYEWHPPTNSNINVDNNADTQDVSKNANYVALAKLATSAVRHYQNSPNIAPNVNNIDHLLKVSTVLLALGRYDEAKQMLQISNKLCDAMQYGSEESRIESQYFLARALAHLGDRPGAEALIKSIVDQKLSIISEDYQGKSYLLSNIALAYEALGDYEKAIEFYDRSEASLSPHMKQDSGDILALELLKARAMSHVGKADQALAMVKHIQAVVDKEKAEFLKSQIWAHMGAIQERRGDENAARDCYEQAIKEQMKFTALYTEFPDMLLAYSAILRHQHFDAAAKQIESQAGLINQAMQRSPSTFSL